MSFYDILVAAKSQDNTLRNQAELALEQIKSSNFGEYILHLSIELHDESKPETFRQFAGVLIKRDLDAQNEQLAEVIHQRWLAVPADTKSTIKNNLVLTLSTGADKARKATAQAIAKVAKIEVPHSLWPELIPGLVSTSVADAVPVGLKASSVDALGMICEEILDTDVFDEDATTQILAAIVTCMDDAQDTEVRLNATAAMGNALDFAEKCFDDAHAAHRDAIMLAICNRAVDSHPPVKRAAFGCLNRVADIYYKQLEPYIDHIAGITSAAAMGDDEAIATHAIEFWSSICDEEADLLDSSDPTQNKRIIERNLGGLVNMTTTLMTRVDEFNDDEEWGVAQAAGVCLAKIATAARDAVVAPVMAFIQENFENPDWRVRDACTVAFGCILEGPNAELLKDYINGALPVMLNKVAGPTKDETAVLRESNAWTVAKTLELHFSQIDIGALFESILNTATLALGDEARVAAKGASILANVAHHMSDYEDNGATPLSPHFQGLVEALFDRLDKEDFDEKKLRVCCFEAINAMVENSSAAEHPFLSKLLDEACRRLNLTFAIPTTEDEKRNLESQQIGCSSLVQAIVIALDADVKPYASYVAEILLRVIDTQASIATVEALYAVASLCDVTENSLEGLLTGVASRLEVLLTRFDEGELVRSAIICVGSVCRNFGQAIIPYVEPFATKLLEVLKSSDLPREVKPYAVSVFGDIASGLGAEHISRYLEPIMHVLGQAANSTLETEDEEDVDHLLNLRAAVVESWVCVFQTFIPAPDDSREYKAELAKITVNAQQYAPPVLGKLREWIFAQADAELPKVDYLKNMFALAGDLTVICGAPAVKEYINPADGKINKLLNHIDRAEKESWGTDTLDDAGRPRETVALYVRGKLAGR